MDGKRRMSKIEIPFHVDKEAEFRFALVLESRSVNAHSLMDSDDNKKILKEGLSLLYNDRNNDFFIKEIENRIQQWKEKHK